jgi:hypothetical protein
MRNRKGQSTFELTLTIVVVVAAVIAMSIFMKRSVMGKLRETGDQMGEQFQPHQTQNNFTRTYTGTRNELSNFDGSGNSTITVAETQDKTGTENVDQDLTAEPLF